MVLGCRLLPENADSSLPRQRYPVSRPVALPTDGAIVAIPHLGGLPSLRTPRRVTHLLTRSARRKSHSTSAMASSAVRFALLEVWSESGNLPFCSPRGSAGQGASLQTVVRNARRRFHQRHPVCGQGATQYLTVRLGVAGNRSSSGMIWSPLASQRHDVLFVSLRRRLRIREGLAPSQQVGKRATAQWSAFEKSGRLLAQHSTGTFGRLGERRRRDRAAL